MWHNMNMNRDAVFAVGEHYHIYNRGAHKSEVFLGPEDYERFALLLYLVNDTTPLDFRRLATRYKGRSFVDMFTGEERKKDMVDILAYALMPNHFHLVVRECSEGGISRFMKKVMTAYAMYFNLKHGHSGVLFQGRFKSRHVGDENYFRWIFSYVHLNPAELVEPFWDRGIIENPQQFRQFMEGYSFSSSSDYRGVTRPQNKILAADVPDFLREQNDLEDAIAHITKDRPLYV